MSVFMDNGLIRNFLIQQFYKASLEDFYSNLLGQLERIQTGNEDRACSI